MTNSVTGGDGVARPRPRRCADRCEIVFGVDQEGADPGFSAVGEVAGDRVTVTVTGEVDMATAGALFRAATPGLVSAATLDLRSVTFFDSAAIHTLVRLADHYAGAIEVFPSDRVRRVLDISGLGEQPWLKAR